MSAAIVSGIVALVLAFVHKEKGRDTRAKISNNPVMKEIIGKMATKRGQHDEVFGYGSLKPFRVFECRAHILWSVIKNLPSILVAPSGVDANHNTKVSKFILSETSVAMYPRQNEDEIQAVILRDRADDNQYPYNYHEDEDNRQIKPCPVECLMKSTLDALDYLKIRKLTNHVKVIHLELPHIPPLSSTQLFKHMRHLDRHRKLLLCDHVLPLIIESEVQVIERLVFPSIDNIYMSDLCRFIKRLPGSLLSGLKSIVLPAGLPFGVLCRIAQILDGGSTATIYVQYGMDFNQRDEETPQECKFPKVTTVKVVCGDQEFVKKFPWKVGFNIPFDAIWNSDLVGRKTMPEDNDEPDTNDDELCSNDDELGSNDDELGSNDDELGSNDDEPGTNDDELGSNDHEPGTNDDKPGTNDHEPGTNDDELGSNDDELGSNDDEPCECLDAKLTHNDNRNTTMNSDHHTNYYTSSNNIKLPKDLSKVTVAILGDAVNIHHEEIKNKIIPDGNFKCFIVPHGGTCEKDRHLGTLCATIIAGELNGMSSSFVDLVYATVINAKARTKPEWVISALEWIEREHANVDIVVIPLGFDTFNLGLFKIINKLSKNMIVVCAASNSRKPLMQKICYPAMYGDVICVGSHQGNTSQPSSFSPQGRELDLLVVEECVGFTYFPLREKLEPEIVVDITSTKYSLSGTCVAAAYATGVISQIVAFALKCGFERQQVTNNTVMRELLKYLTCNSSHDPRSGYGWIKNLSESELFKSTEYFKMIVKEILGIDE